MSRLAGQEEAIAAVYADGIPETRVDIDTFIEDSPGVNIQFFEKNGLVIGGVSWAENLRYPDDLDWASVSITPETRHQGKFNWIAAKSVIYLQSIGFKRILTRSLTPTMEDILRKMGFVDGPPHPLWGDVRLEASIANDDDPLVEWARAQGA